MIWILWAHTNTWENKKRKREDLILEKSKMKEWEQVLTKFTVKGGNVSRRKRNHDCEVFGMREEESEGNSKSVAIKPSFRSVITMKTNVYLIEMLGHHHLLYQKYTGGLLLFGNTVKWLLSTNSTLSSLSCWSFTQQIILNILLSITNAFM